MRKLLVPIDSSDNSIRALRYAIDLAKTSGPVELHLVYAHEPPVIYGEVALYMSEAKAKEAQRLHSEDILQPAIAMVQTAGVPVKSEILIGNVPKSIAQYAEGHGCESIIMGTRGMGAIGNLVMGSVATKVIHLTKLPVTLVK
jgi:nucleotide-binding universal stress UspA family protein